MHDVQDKSYWCALGVEQEKQFVTKICPYLHINAVINPEKVHNPYAPDLLVNGEVADLKYQSIPFFMSNALYHKDSQYVVVFNKKDFERYMHYYPHITIYFWVHFTDTAADIGGEHYEVKPMRGVWRVPFKRICELIPDAPLHHYKNRVDDHKGNGKASYLLDVRQMEQVAMRMN
jgi:hypothetical protein